MSILISHSDISSFLRCRRQFSWGYLDDRKPPDQHWGPLATGGRVHLAIDTFHRTGEDAMDVHQRLAVVAETAMKDAGAPSWALQELYNDIVIGRNCINAYMEWMATEGPYDGYSLMSEVQLEAPILGGRAILRGKADLLLIRDADGWMFIDDLKTSSAHVRTTLPVVLERSYQHWVYMVLVQMLHPEAIIGGAHYTVLYKVKVPARAKHPMVERIRTPATMSQAANKLAQIENIVSDMLDLMEKRESLGSNVAYPIPGDSCRWCPFKHPCLIADENPLGARAMLDTEFLRGGRHARYDD